MHVTSVDFNIFLSFISSIYELHVRLFPSCSFMTDSTLKYLWSECYISLTRIPPLSALIFLRELRNFSYTQQPDKIFTLWIPYSSYSLTFSSLFTSSVSSAGLLFPPMWVLVPAWVRVPSRRYRSNGPKVNASPYSSSDKGTRRRLSSGGVAHHSDQRDLLRDSPAVSGDQGRVVSKFLVWFLKIHRPFFPRYFFFQGSLI